MMAGALRHRITIQERRQTPDDYGGQAETWADVCTLWADPQPQTGVEKEELGAPRSVQRMIFVTRWFKGITPQMRLSWRNQLFDITAVVDVDSRRRTLQITAQQGLSRG